MLRILGVGETMGMHPDLSDPGSLRVSECWNTEREHGIMSGFGSLGAGVGRGQVGAGKRAVPLNLLLEPKKQNSFVLCVGVMIDWEDSLNANGSLQARDGEKKPF